MNNNKQKILSFLIVGSPRNDQVRIYAPTFANNQWWVYCALPTGQRYYTPFDTQQETNEFVQELSEKWEVSITK